MPVSTRSSSFPATRSRDKKKSSYSRNRHATPAASHKASGSLPRAKKVLQAKESATKASQVASRAQVTASSSTTRLEGEGQGTEVSHLRDASITPATRSRRATTVVMSVEVPRTSSRLSRTTSTVQVRYPSRKRTADALNEETAVPPLKRKRTTPIAIADAEIRALHERESALSEREDVMRRRELAVQIREEQESTNKQLQVKIDKLNRKMKISMARFKQAERDWEAKAKVLTDERDMLVEKTASMKVSPASKYPSANLQWLLSHLEDQFQCSLCFEIMANPYSLNNGRCGHAFCAICILKWAFTAVHRSCGYWHEALECPLCRATLPYTPEATPRNICTFPFVPDRLADTVIRSHLAVLQDAADSKAKPTASYSGGESHHGIYWHGEVDEQVLAWGEGKASRNEWEQRERNGKTQMTLLFDNWSQYKAVDFISLKDRLKAA
ncbi:hypothetical protein C8T65DRAFT_639684 [Cerioporus squamosus]|nr:hypothetical protein C8T65DRAFT_639684 [Cerioporus squamosus]